MPGRLFTRAAAVVAAGLTLSALPAASALVAPPAASGGWDSYTVLVGSAQFSRLGRVPGQAGNAHTGDISFDTSDDPVAGNLFDWQCPAGEAPPRYGRANDTDCVLLDWEAISTNGAPDRQDFPTATGPLSSTFDSPLDFVDEYPTLNGPAREATVQLRFSRTGPISRTVEDLSTDTTDDIVVTQTAPMRLTGRVDWIWLGSPKVTVQVSDYRRITEYTRPTR